MQLFGASILSLLAVIASVVVAKPLSDVHATSLELYAVNALHDGGRFAVAVSREDDLVEKGDVVGKYLWEDERTLCDNLDGKREDNLLLPSKEEEEDRTTKNIIDLILFWTNVNQCSNGGGGIVATDYSSCVSLAQIFHHLPPLPHYHKRYGKEGEGKDDELNGRHRRMAAKFTDIIMVFDVTPSGDVILNNKTIPMGLSNVQVEAATIYGINKSDNMTREQLEKSFDVGVVGIQVLATSEKVLIDNVNVTRIAIAERVYELNGQQVVQGNQEDNVVGQIIDVYPDGKMVRQPACPMAVGETLMPSPRNKHMRGCMRRLARWFNALPMTAKAIFIAVSGTAMLLFYASIARLAFLLIRGPEEHQTEPYEFVLKGEDGVVVQKYEKVAIVYEAPEEDEEALPAYGQGYTALSTKEEKL
ncbi:hypothetical protein HDU97_002097 [Phlyctochytrium planicorne]|nr:hypothetical protein HDU97_002097 [Phlyctochytrium planicorne]